MSDRKIPEDRDGFEEEDGCPEIDDDDDGIVDREDACPRVKGGRRGPEEERVSLGRRDGDGVPDKQDACPALGGPPRTSAQRLSHHGHGREIGSPIPSTSARAAGGRRRLRGRRRLPDPDDDRTASRTERRVPRTPGEPSTSPVYNGCPNEDRDGDTFLNDDDECPDAPEVFNGIRDEDGCPDEGGKALVVVEGRDPAKPALRLAAPLKLAGAPTRPRSTRPRSRSCARSPSSCIATGLDRGLGVRPAQGAGRGGAGARSRHRDRGMAREARAPRARRGDGGLGCGAGATRCRGLRRRRRNLRRACRPPAAPPPPPPKAPPPPPHRRPEARIREDLRLAVCMLALVALALGAVEGGRGT